MTGDLADWLGEDIDPSIVFEYPTIKELAHQLSLTVQKEGVDGAVEA
jgi:hypothetical protein